MKTVEQNAELSKQRELLYEARQRYERSCATAKELRGRMAILLSAELAIMTYMFTDLTSIIPNELYGQIIFAIACLGVLASIGTLFMYYKSTSNWPSPIGDIDRANLSNKNDELEVLKYIENDYFSANEEAQCILKKRGRAFNFSMHIFILSAIILLILKVFKGA